MISLAGGRTGLNANLHGLAGLRPLGDRAPWTWDVWKPGQPTDLIEQPRAGQESFLIM